MAHRAQYTELFDERIRLVRGEVTGIDLKSVSNGFREGRAKPIAYDVLVLAVGGVTNYAGVEGADEYALPFRKIAHADHLRQRMVETLDRVAPDLRRRTRAVL